MRKVLTSLFLVPMVSLALAATPVSTPLPKKPHKFNRPANPEIRVTNVTVNSVKMWQVEVLKGTLELTDFTKLREGMSMSLPEDRIVWRMGQIVLIGEDGVWAGGKKWAAGTKLFVDEKGKFYPVAGHSPAVKPQK